MRRWSLTAEPSTSWINSFAWSICTAPRERARQIEWTEEERKTKPERRKRYILLSSPCPAIEKQLIPFSQSEGMKSGSRTHSSSRLYFDLMLSTSNLKAGRWKRVWKVIQSKLVAVSLRSLRFPRRDLRYSREILGTYVTTSESL